MRRGLLCVTTDSRSVTIPGIMDATEKHVRGGQMRGRKGRRGPAKRSLEGAEREQRTAVAVSRRPEALELHHFWEGDAVRLADRPGTAGDLTRYVVDRSIDVPTHASGRSGLTIRPAGGGPSVVALADDLYHVDRCEKCRRSWVAARALIPRQGRERGSLYRVDAGSLVLARPVRP